MGQFLRRVGDGTDPVVDDVVPELLTRKEVRSLANIDRMRWTCGKVREGAGKKLTEKTQFIIKSTKIQPNFGSSQSVGTVGGTLRL